MFLSHVNLPKLKLQPIGLFHIMTGFIILMTLR